MNLECTYVSGEDKFLITFFENEQNKYVLTNPLYYKILWSQSGESKIIVSGKELTLNANQVLCTSPSSIIDIPSENTRLIGILFTNKFYDIIENNAEVLCWGLLYHGLSPASIVNLNNEQKKIFDALLLLITQEFTLKDFLQEEMLRSFLKRMLKNFGNLYRNSGITEKMSDKQVDLIKTFNKLVELHFKGKHQVADYAEMLSKSPKTLSNFFKKQGAPSPLNIINSRITAEAKSLLKFTDKSAEEIAQELGYKEPSHFSKFFKTHTGQTPLAFRKQSTCK